MELRWQRRNFGAAAAEVLQHCSEGTTRTKRRRYSRYSMGQLAGNRVIGTVTVFTKASAVPVWVEAIKQNSNTEEIG
jgi:hypothetical protein